MTCASAASGSRASTPGGVDHGARRHRATLELLGQIGTIAIGRGAYEDMVRGWPGSDNPMAVLMNTLPKVVFSQTLSGVAWSNARLSRAPIEEEIPALKREPGKDLIVFGGARIAQSLIRHRLIDEYRLTVHPVALGDGLSLMHGLPSPQRLELISAPPTPTAASPRSSGLPDRARPAPGRVRGPGPADHDYGRDSADRGHALPPSGGSANAIAFPSGCGTSTWRTPFE